MSPSSETAQESPAVALQRPIRQWLTGSPFAPRPEQSERSTTIKDGALALAITRQAGTEAVALHVLEPIFAAGLALREGRSIEAPVRQIYVELRHLGLEAVGLSVCGGPGCGVVFSPARKARASLCPRCHASPLRLPYADVPTFLRFGNLPDPDTRRPQILRDCKDCGVEFWAGRGRRYCPDCATPAARVRRHRASA